VADPFASEPPALISQVRGLLAAGRALEAAVAGRLNMSATDLAAIEHLLAAGPVTHDALAARLQLRPSSTTALVDRLERAGHAQRAPHPHSRRSILVHATRDAEQRANAGRAVLSRRLAELAERYDETQRQLIGAFLADLTQLLDEETRALNRGQEP
jgi:DNA-binding MarR family transcriptional regulator